MGISLTGAHTRNGGTIGAIGCYRTIPVKGANLSINLAIHGVILHHIRLNIQLDTIFTPFYRNSVITSINRHRNFAANKNFSLFAAHSNDIGLGQNFGIALFYHGIELSIDFRIGAKPTKNIGFFTTIACTLTHGKGARSTQNGNTTIIGVRGIANSNAQILSLARVYLYDTALDAHLLRLGHLQKIDNLTAKASRNLFGAILFVLVLHGAFKQGAPTSHANLNIRIAN